MMLSVILISMLMLILFSKFHQASDLRQQLELTSQLEPDLEEKWSFKMLGLSSSSKLEWGSYIISIAKTACKKIRALIRFMKFLSLEVVLQPCMEYCCHLWGGTTSCYLELIDSYKNGYVGLLVFDLLPLLSPWLIVKI